LWDIGEGEREQRQREYIRKRQQATARNDANEGEWTQVGERGQGSRGTKEQTSAQKASGNKDGQNGSKESERESNISTSKHEKCNRQRVAMTKESGSEGTTKMVCQATKSKQV
jgi:hypothetical protein